MSALGMGLPYRDELVDILEANLTPEEAEVALLLPNRVAPFEVLSAQKVADRSSRRPDEVLPHLESLAAKHLLFTHPTGTGEQGYALHQAGYGFPQVFHWGGQATEHAARMAGMVGRYADRNVTIEMYGETPTKPYRYVPPKEAVPGPHDDMADRHADTSDEAHTVPGRDMEAVPGEGEREIVYPYDTMEKIVGQARRFAVAHCTCRMARRLLGRECGHPLEVCMKFDDLADYLIEHGLGREITREEALEVVRVSEEAGLVHFVDNCAGDLRHNCNCCGDACWNVGNIRRRRIPRDLIMATYFLRETDKDGCSGCGVCAEICPVACVEMVESLPVIDDQWCIGCGVCVHKCPENAARLRVRDDVDGELPADFAELHERILREKDYRK
jgi:NAD-dependent dihydropyrimidine dehydrogenase PreA subunit